MKDLFNELKRRKVFRVATVYLIATWFLIQLADTLFPILNLPEWSVRLITVFLLIGFPIAVILAWAFEMTPEGIKRAEDVDPSQQDNGRKTDFIIIAVLIVVIVIAGVERMFFADSEDEIVAETTEVTEPEPATDISADSIAVLPFVNMSADEENEYFSDGLSEELLNVLARVEGLRVTSRTSAFAFKGQQLDIQTIAKRLKVRHVLEGSVRKSGNNVRITAQLIDTQTDTHLWSDTYDRKLENIFEIQDEISQNIVGQLMKVLGRDAVVVSVEAATENLQAYERYLQGRHLFLRRGADNLFKAAENLEKAVELDPEFVRAWATLAGTYAVISDYTPDITQDDAFAKSMAAAERAIEIDANQAAEAYAVLGLMAGYRFNYGVSLGHFERAIELGPRDAMPRLWQGIVFLRLGYLDKALDTIKTAYALEPAVGVVNAWLGFALVAADNLDAAEAAHNRSRDLGFGTFSLRGLAQISARRGDFASARKIQEVLVQESSASGNPLPEFYLAAVDAMYAGKAGDDLLAKVNELTKENPVSWPFYLAIGELEKAVAVFSRDAQPKPDGQPARTVAHAVVWFPVYRAIVEHPGFLEHAKVIKLYDYWEQHGYPDHCPRVDDHLECDSE